MKTVQQLTETLTWTLDDGTLTISGTGAMPDYTHHPFNAPPWHEYKDNITTVDIQDGVTTIGDAAFYKCSSITSITIPNSVTKIGHSAFYCCGNIASLTIPDSVTNIGGSILFNCCALRDVVVLSKTPPALAGSPFCDDNMPVPFNIVTLNVPQGCLEAYKKAAGWKDFETIQAEANITWTLDNGTLTISGTGAMPAGNGDDIVPPWFDKYGGNIITVNIQDGITSIGDYAFHNCRNLTSVTIPNSVTNIGYSAFSHCYKLTSVTIPGSVTNIELNAFYACTSLTSITVPNSETSVGNISFSFGYKLCFLTGAVGDCGNLPSIVEGSNNVVYASEDGVLFDKSKEIIIKYPSAKAEPHYNIPDSVIFIGHHAFESCHIASITIPNSVTGIGEFAFNDCPDITSIIIPNSVTTIGYHAFDDCRRLASITIPESVTSIEAGAFISCEKLTSITIPESVTSIEIETFALCESLTSITIPNSVTTIGNWAFSHCKSLISITIPDSVTTIGKEAFAKCTGLKNVTVLSTTPPLIESFIFENVPLLSATLTVPQGCKALYKAANGWKDFGTITEQ